MMTGMCRPGWVANSEDCDDARSETYRGARELCDGRDNDCGQPGAMAGGTIRRVLAPDDISGIKALYAR